MKESHDHKEPKQKPSGRLPKENATNRQPKTLARQAWLKSKEKVVSATRTKPDGNYASAQEMEKFAVQQSEFRLEDGTILALRKTEADANGRLTRKRKPEESQQGDWMYRDSPELREKNTPTRGSLNINPQATAKRKRQRRTAANAARKEKQANQAAQRTQRIIHQAQQAARESAGAVKKVLSAIRAATRHLLAALQNLVATFTVRYVRMEQESHLVPRPSSPPCFCNRHLTGRRNDLLTDS